MGMSKKLFEFEFEFVRFQYMQLVFVPKYDTFS
jgi:hypothetical protein